MNDKPRAPHITVYSVGIVPMMSMAHRLSGVFLILIIPITTSILALSLLLPNLFNYIATTWILAMLFALFIFNIVLHIILGIRHMIWDFGIGFSKPYIKYSGYFALYASIMITFLWFYIFFISNG